MNIKNLTHSTLACLVATLAAGCATVPMTGRTQLMLIPPATEMKLGAQAYEEVLAKETLSTDQRMKGILDRVGRRIAAQANQPDFDWEFKLIESEKVNAFALPGGKIAVYTGILPIMQNEAGMAAVLGHEVAHAIARHGGERMSQSLGVALVLEIASRGLGGADKDQREKILAALGAGATVGVMLPFSRKHELEADLIGMRYAAAAGYDPNEAVKLWQRMQAASKGKPPEILSTHPAESRRIAQMKEHMPQAMQLYNKAPNQLGLGEPF